MSTLPLLLAIAQAAGPVPDRLNVHMVDNGLGVRDLVVPLGALLAGIGGVLLGGVIQHRLENKRTVREERLDLRRADRERDAEQERQRRMDDADKRRTIGALRLARRFMARARSDAGFALRARDWWSVELRWLESPLQPEDERLMAAWLTHDAWGAYSTAAGQVALLPVVKGMAGDSRQPIKHMVRTLEGLHTGVTDAIVALRAEETRLAREIGDPRAEYEWEPLSEDTWPRFGEHSKDAAVEHGAAAMEGEIDGEAE